MVLDSSKRENPVAVNLGSNPPPDPCPLPHDPAWWQSWEADLAAVTDWDGDGGWARPEPTAALLLGRAATLLHAELLRLAERLAAAREAAWRATAAGAAGQALAAEEERQEAAGLFHAASRALAHLGLFLIRKAVEHEPAAARLYLVDLFAPEFRDQAAATAALEARLRRLEARR